MSLLRSRQVASVSETVAATPLPAIVMEGLSYIYIGEKQLNIYIYIYIYIFFFFFFFFFFSVSEAGSTTILFY